MTRRRLFAFLAPLLLLPGTRALAAPQEDDEEEASYPAWDWGGSVSVTAGYDDNISVSSLVRFGDKRGSGTTNIKGKIGPSLELSEKWSLELVYAFEQSVCYSDHDLDAQTHKATLSASLALKRVEATLGYAFMVDALISTSRATLYSLDHLPSLSVEVLLKKPLYVGLDYAFHYYDVRDAEYAYLKGQRHLIEIYPEIYLARKLTLYGGYRLELVRIGETVEEVETGFGGMLQVTAPQSYDGHYFYLSAKWRPVRPLALMLDGRIGVRRYTDPMTTTGTGAGPGPGGGTRTFARNDVVGTIEPGVSWNFWDGLSLEAWFYYERSSSSVMTRRVLASSYDNIAASGGVRWEF